MTVRWHDATIPLQQGMPVWPGDPAFEFAPLLRMSRGDSCNTSIVSICTHVGTHVDAPWHFEEEGKRLHEMDTGLFFGEATLIHALAVDVVGASELGEGPLPERVLLRTRNSEFCVGAGAGFRSDYVALGADAATRLVEEGVRLVGIDYLSIAPFGQSDQASHHILLKNDVLVVEGLRLKGLPRGRCLFTMLPMALSWADGAPCRAFVGY